MQGLGMIDGGLAALAAAGLIALAGAVPARIAPPDTTCSEAARLAPLAADLAFIAHLRDPQGLASHLAQKR
jgi:hypothetical protein